VRITERCERLQIDMVDFLKTLVPAKTYRHDESTVDDRPNARSHIMSLFMNASESVPVSNGRFSLGEWQSVFFVELDGPRRERRVLVQIIGE
jgi:secondary thiamine-phosphate synthase enzyme